MLSGAQHSHPLAHQQILFAFSRLFETDRRTEVRQLIECRKLRGMNLAGRGLLLIRQFNRLQHNETRRRSSLTHTVYYFRSSRVIDWRDLGKILRASRESFAG